MTEETRTEKALRKINEEIDREKGIVSRMSVDEKQVLAVLIMVVAVLAIVATLLWSGIARSAEQASVRVTTQCLKGVCLIDVELYKALVESHNEAATRPVVKCKNNNEI